MLAIYWQNDEGIETPFNELSDPHLLNLAKQLIRGAERWRLQHKSTASLWEVLIHFSLLWKVIRRELSNRKLSVETEIDGYVNYIEKMGLDFELGQLRRTRQSTRSIFE